MFLGKGILKICSKFTGEHPCRSVISSSKALWHRWSPVNLLHIFRTPFYKNTSGGLCMPYQGKNVLQFSETFYSWIHFWPWSCWRILFLSYVTDSHRNFSPFQKQSCRGVLWKKVFLENLAKCTGKHLCQCLFFNKVAGQACKFVKKRLWHRCFLVNFAKFFGTLFCIEHLWWLLSN